MVEKLSWEVIDAARFKLDGGAMNGIVDRAIWEGKQGWSADNGHMVELSNSLPIIRLGRQIILVDTGIGRFWQPKKQTIHQMNDETELRLKQAGVDREEVTDVIFTHLHWDHAGGVIRPKDTDAHQPEETFPHARYHINAKQWKNALNPHPAEAGSYRLGLEIKTLQAAHQNKRLNLVEGDQFLFNINGVKVSVMDTGDGHTVGHQMVYLHESERTYAYFGDLVPTTYHLNVLHGMAYDLDRRELAKHKQRVLEQAVAEKWQCYFDHELDALKQGVQLQTGERAGVFEIVSNPGVVSK